MSVSLDGATYFRGATPRIADAKTGTLAIWLKPASFGSVKVLFSLTADGSSAAGLSLSTTSPGRLALVGRSAAGLVRLNVQTVLTLTADQWALALMSWDLAQSAVDIYVNDTESTDVGSATDDTLEYSKDQLLIGATDSGGGKTLFFDGELDYVFFSTTYLDLSVEANRRFFYGPLGEQIGLGAEARRPLSGNRPEVFLAGGAGNYGRNIGTSGDLEPVGSPDNSYGRPAAVETLSRGFRGEAWRESQRSGIPFPESELVHEPASGLEVARREFSTDRDEERRGRHYRRRGVGVRG